MNKSKKSKSDICRAAVGIYLKQKSYVGSDKDKFRKSDFLLLQNKKQFAFQKMMERDLHCGNHFQYSNALCIANNPQIVDQQFGKFSQFVESQEDELRTELKRFYGPILCHLYLELLKAREPKAATEFLKKHAHLLAPVDSNEAPPLSKVNGCSMPTDAGYSDSTSSNAQQNSGTNPALSHNHIHFTREALATEDADLEYFMKLIQALSGYTKLETAEADSEVLHFRSSEYEIHTTAAVVDTLKGYFEKRGHVLILNLLYTWVHVHIIDNEVQQWTEDSLFLSGLNEEEPEEDMQEEKSKARTGCTERSTAKRSAEEPPDFTSTATKTTVKMEQVCTDGTETEEEDTKKRHSIYNVHTCLQTLQDCGAQLAKVQKEFPRFIQIGEQNRGLTSAQLDASECHLVAGFNSSVVQLWQLNQHSFCGKQLYRRFEDACCPWELNNCWREEEDEVEEDINEQMHSSTKINLNEKRRSHFESRKYNLNTYTEQGGITLRGHSLGITDVRFSAHYPLLYSTSKDTHLRCWRAENFSCAGIYRGHRYPIWCVDESPVGMYTATGSKDLTARLWSLEREFPLITYTGHTQDVECLAFHPNGNYIATGSSDLSVRLWCVTSGKLMRVFSDCKQPVTCVNFSPDGKMLAVGGEETKIRIFDLAAGSQLNELKEHSACVTSIAWNKSGNQLASACRDGSLRLWDVKKLVPMHESGNTAYSSNTNSTSSSSSSSSASPSRLLTLSSHCQRLVKVDFRKNNTICCIGS